MTRSKKWVLELISPAGCPESPRPRWSHALRGGSRISGYLAVSAASIGLIAITALRIAADEGNRLPPATMHMTSEGAGNQRAWIFGLARRGDELWSVGSLGIRVKRPGINGWTQALPPGNPVPLAIAFAPSGLGVAVGQEGAVWEAQPGSDKWTKVDAGESQRLFSVATSPTGEFVATGSFGAILRRPAGSTKWERVPTQWEKFDGPHLYGVLFIDDATAVAVGERGTVLRLSNGQIASQQEHGEESLFAVAHCGPSLIAAGQEGRVLIEDGTDWRAAEIPDRPDIFGLGCLDGGRIAAASAGFLEVGTARDSSWTWQRWEPNSTRVGWYSFILPNSQGALLLAGQGDIWRVQLTAPTEQAELKPQQAE